MKVYFKYSLTGYSGTINHAVYYYHPRLHRSLMRKYVYPAESERNVRMKSAIISLDSRGKHKYVILKSD